MTYDLASFISVLGLFYLCIRSLLPRGPWDVYHFRQSTLASGLRVAGLFYLYIRSLLLLYQFSHVNLTHLSFFLKKIEGKYMKDNRKSKDSRNRKTIIRYKNRHPCLDRRRPGSLLLLLILLLLRLGLRELCVCILQCTHVCFHTHIFTQMFPPPHPHALVMLPYTHMHIMDSRPASVVGLFQLYIRSLLPLSL